MHMPGGAASWSCEAQRKGAPDERRYEAKGADGERIVSRAICMLPCFERVRDGD